MLRQRARFVAVCAAVVLLSGCSEQRESLSSVTPVSPSAPEQAARPPDAPPMGSSFKNCRGGRNLHWWVAHIEEVTAADLEALASLNLANADRSAFDPADSASLAAWIKAGARTDNIFYALSLQLAISELNVRHGFAPDAGTFVLRDQANRELARENPSLGFMETILENFERCQ